MIKICGREGMRSCVEMRAVGRKVDRNIFHVAAALICLAAAGAARAESLVVVEARGIASTAGTLIDSASHLTLRQGEHVRLIGENGNQYCLDGPYEGPAKPQRSLVRRSQLNLRNSGERGQADALTDCIQ